jgi:hypothetical protein
MDPYILKFIGIVQSRSQRSMPVVLPVLRAFALVYEVRMLQLVMKGWGHFTPEDIAAACKGSHLTCLMSCTTRWCRQNATNPGLT